MGGGGHTATPHPLPTAVPGDLWNAVLCSQIETGTPYMCYKVPPPPLGMGWAQCPFWQGICSWVASRPH